MIVIAGDSWGCGEWDLKSKQTGPTKGVSHLGTEFFLLEQGNVVKNISQSGGSNKHTIKLLSNLDLTTHDIVVVFQTDPMRDLISIELNNTRIMLEAVNGFSANQDFTAISSYEDLLKLRLSLIAEFYKNLAKLPSRVLLLGGLSKIKLDLLPQNSNVIPLIDSIIEFLVPNFEHPETWNPSGYWVKALCKIDHIFHQNRNIKDLTKLMKDQKKGDLLRDVAPHYFVPDGTHPNRHAHKIIANKIMDYIQGCEYIHRINDPK